MRNLAILEAAKHLQPHPEEPAKRASRRMATGTVEQAAILRDARILHQGLRGALLRMTCEVFRTLVASLLLLLPFSIGAAHAHAFLDHAEPRVGNTVKGQPRTVALWFTQNLESAFSTIEVKALPAGTYTVKWHVLSVDTHTTEGNFTFHVAP
jgi:copper resistance protein C